MINNNDCRIKCSSCDILLSMDNMEGRYCCENCNRDFCSFCASDYMGICLCTPRLKKIW